MDIALKKQRVFLNAGLGLLDETPMPLVLYIKRLPDGRLLFKQTEHTKKYLA